MCPLLAEFYVCYLFHCIISNQLNYITFNNIVFLPHRVDFIIFGKVLKSDVPYYQSLSYYLACKIKTRIGQVIIINFIELYYVRVAKGLVEQQVGSGYNNTNTSCSIIVILRKYWAWQLEQLTLYSTVNNSIYTLTRVGHSLHYGV